MIRLNKYLSEAGICSRREADRLILAGKVTVDGEKAAPGTKVEEGQEVRIGKKVVNNGSEKIVLAVNKLAGIICTEDRRVRNSIVRFLDYPVRVTYAGRLDKDSEGLLLMTNDGSGERTGRGDQAVPGIGYGEIYLFHRADPGSEPPDQTYVRNFWI